MSIANKLATIAENEQKVYDAGKKAEYDAFWDTLQGNGKRTDYVSAFYSKYWTADNFRPKYQIKPSSLSSCFSSSAINADLTELCNLDTSNCTVFASAFTYSRFTRIGVIDARKATSLGSLFAYNAYLETIDKVIFSDDGTQGIANYTNCSSLKNIRYEGKVGLSTNFQWCPLTAESIVSVVEALSENVSGLTATFKRTAVNDADWSATEYASWDELIATKPNWTFSLI